jgi:hypothetical protein
LGATVPDRYSEEAWIKHLEFIQAAITRMAGNSFLLKGWALTVSGALFGFSAGRLSWPIAAVGLLPIIAFWALDAYFLMQERMFRSLYNAVAGRDQGIPVFSLNASGYRQDDSWRNAAFSGTLAVYYGGLLAAGIALVIAAAVAG